MSYLREEGSIVRRIPLAVTVEKVKVEVIAARTKFPKGRNLLPALMEEVGELAQTLLQDGNTEKSYKEAKQVAAVAIRIMEESCPEFDNLDSDQRQK